MTPLPLRIVKDLILGFKSEAASHRETEPNLDPFDGLDTHQSLRQPPIELSVPLDIAS